MARGTSPTLETIGLIAAVFVVDRLLGVVGMGTVAFALAWPLTERPWTLATSVYAHASLGHLAANAVALGLIGLVLERATTRLRFHAFFLVAGGLAGAAQVAVGAVLGQSTVVLGASGAVLALYGYVLVGNRASAAVLDRLPLGRHVQFALLVLAAVAVTVLTAGPGVALVAHFTGILLGAIAGRARVLRPGRNA